MVAESKGSEKGLKQVALYKQPHWRRPIKKIIMIDDHAELLRSLGNALRGAILLEECHGVMEAVVAIMTGTPNILLLDHQLSQDGDEGFEVVEWVRKNIPNIEIFSTTKNDKAKKAYAAMGIGWVDKQSLAELRKFIAEHTQ